MSLLSAELIYDGANGPEIPARLLPEAPPNAGHDYLPEEIRTFQMALVNEKQQLVGTAMEKLCEIAGRACYDSFGRGRDSAAFHKHILEVGHLSVVEHAAFTVAIPVKPGGTMENLLGLAACFLNKPSVHIELDVKNLRVLATLNLRHVLEWGDGGSEYNLMGEGVRRVAGRLAPEIVKPIAGRNTAISAELIEPVTPSQCWVSMLLTGSRGFSHELVRHGDWTAISQRSTRYVDESESPWVMHPLELAYNVEHAKRLNISPDTVVDNDYVSGMKELYAEHVGWHEKWLIDKGVDKTTARKQARGAARGYLGNALYTEVVFSANCAQWLRMLKQRLHPAADAEIREVFAHALKELQRSQHGKFFGHLTTVPSPDGIGVVLA